MQTLFVRRNWRVALPMFILSAFLFAACGKDGGVGPAGPAGANGTNGTNGTNGNANVKVDTFSVVPASWKYGSVYWFTTGATVSEGYISQTFTRKNSLITADILKSGMVLVYFTSSSLYYTNTWTPMPFSFAENFSGAYTFNYAYTTDIGTMSLFFFFGKGSGNAPSLSTYIVPATKVKVIIVSGTVVANGRSKNVDLKNYRAVAEWLGLKD